jgi:hypothetical protein
MVDKPLKSILDEYRDECINITNESNKDIYDKFQIMFDDFTNQVINRLKKDINDKPFEIRYFVPLGINIWIYHQMVTFIHLLKEKKTNHKLDLDTIINDWCLKNNLIYTSFGNIEYNATIPPSELMLLKDENKKLRVQIEQLNAKITELELRPPEIGGKLYNAGKEEFEKFANLQK